MSKHSPPDVFSTFPGYFSGPAGIHDGREEAEKWSNNAPMLARATLGSLLGLSGESAALGLYRRGFRRAISQTRRGAFGFLSESVALPPQKNEDFRSQCRRLQDMFIAAPPGGPGDELTVRPRLRVPRHEQQRKGTRSMWKTCVSRTLVSHAGGHARQSSPPSMARLVMAARARGYPMRAPTSATRFRALGRCRCDGESCPYEQHHVTTRKLKLSQNISRTANFAVRLIFWESLTLCVRGSNT